MKRKSVPPLITLPPDASVPPPAGSWPYGVYVAAVTSGSGILLRSRATYVAPGSRPGYMSQNQVGQLVRRAWVPTHARPDAALLARAASRAAWDMSTSQLWVPWEGEEPLPGL